MIGSNKSNKGEIIINIKSFRSCKKILIRKWTQVLILRLESYNGLGMTLTLPYIYNNVEYKNAHLKYI